MARYVSKNTATQKVVITPDYHKEQKDGSFLPISGKSLKFNDWEAYTDDEVIIKYLDNNKYHGILWERADIVPPKTEEVVEPLPVIEPVAEVVEEVEAIEEVVEEVDYDSLSYAQLKKMCAEKKIDAKGKKDVLLERLKQL